jgi:hypothetical protein
MAEKSRGIKDLTTFQGIPVDDPVLAAQLEQLRPRGRYFEPYPVQGIKSITKYDTIADPNTLGYAQSRAPDYITDYFNNGETKIPANKVVRIRPRNQYNPSDPSHVYGTFEHERQHILNQIRNKENTWPFNQGLAGADMSDTADIRRHLPNRQLDTPKWAKDANVDENSISTQRAINDFFKKYHKDLSEDFRGSGFFSEVRRIEQALPPGVVLSETPLGQELFKDRPELLTAYLDATRPQYATTIREDTGSPRYKYFEPESPNKQQGIMSLIRDYFKKATTY